MSLRTLLELAGRDGGTVRVARLEGDPTPWLFLGITVGPVVSLQRLTRDQAVEMIDVLEEWLFDTSAEGSRRPPPAALNTSTVRR